MNKKDYEAYISALNRVEEETEKDSDFMDSKGHELLFLEGMKHGQSHDNHEERRREIRFLIDKLIAAVATYGRSREREDEDQDRLWALVVLARNRLEAVLGISR